MNLSKIAWTTEMKTLIRFLLMTCFLNSFVFLVNWFQCSWSIGFSVHDPLVSVFMVHWFQCLRPQVSVCHLLISFSVFPANRVPVNHLWLQETSEAGAVCSPSSTITYKQPKRTTEHQYNLQIVNLNTEQQQTLQIATSNTLFQHFYCRNQAL